jgi:hypothetical protein
MRRGLRRAALIGSWLVLLVLPRPVLAESTAWTLTVSPLTATTGVSTSFTLTATNADPLASLLSSNEIGCVVVDLPSTFAVASTTVSAASTGDSWVAGLSGTRVTVRATSGGDRLETLDWVRFRVTATPLSAGELAWGARAYRDQDCGGSGALLGVPPVVLVTGLAVSPTLPPAPTLTPLPSLTPLPTLAPLPTRTPLPSLVPPPTRSPAPTPRPAATPPTGDAGSPDSGGPAVPAPESAPRSPDSTATPSPDATLTPSPDTGGGGEPGAPATGPGAGAAPPLLRPDGDDVPVSLGPLGAIGAIDVWIVPGLLFGVPGLLVILFAVLQAGGALAWMPAIRRLRGAGEQASAG